MQRCSAVNHTNDCHFIEQLKDIRLHLCFRASLVAWMQVRQVLPRNPQDLQLIRVTRDEIL